MGYTFFGLCLFVCVYVCDYFLAGLHKVQTGYSMVVEQVDGQVGGVNRVHLFCVINFPYSFQPRSLNLHRKFAHVLKFCTYLRSVWEFFSYISILGTWSFFKTFEEDCTYFVLSTSPTFCTQTQNFLPTNCKTFPIYYGTCFATHLFQTFAIFSHIFLSK